MANDGYALVACVLTAADAERIAGLLPPDAWCYREPVPVGGPTGLLSHFKQALSVAAYDRGPGKRNPTREEIDASREASLRRVAGAA